MSTALHFYTRADCHLCDDARVVVGSVLADRDDVTFHEIDIDAPDTPADLRARYDWDVPVVVLDGRQHSVHRVDAGRLRSALDRLAAR
ncbi:glutaredoxin family protein [Brevibacterium litoralis]|uniref:glutaredoxin family protein n=1 Tax=Brevibacterium litoralis TaxID=3138935 RepID=UPI0032EF2C77